jgi:hypothetical protein
LNQKTARVGRSPAPQLGPAVTQQSSLASLRLVLAPSDTTGRIAVDFGSFLEFSLSIDIELETLVERAWENDLRRTAGRRP